MKASQHLKSTVEHARRGDRAAFDTLVKLHRFRIRAFIERRATFYVGPPLDAEEVLQETFVRALESIDRFQWQGDDSVFTWLCGIAKHAILKSAEKAQREQQAGSAQHLPAPGTSPSAALRRHERFDRLKESLASLSPEYRKVVTLARLEGLKIKEIARRMNRSPNAVAHLLARALKQLKREFGDTESFNLPHRTLDSGATDDGR